MITRRLFALLTIALAAPLAGCGGGSSSGGPPPPPPPPPAPTISAVAPASITLGVLLGSFDVLGANLSGSAQVFIDGQPAVYTNLIDSGTLQVTLSDSVSTTLGTHQVTVQQSSGTSNASPFTVYAPQPVPTVMNALPAYLVGNENDPQSVVVGDVNGDGFADVLVPDWPNSRIAILNGNADGSLSSAQVLSVSQAYAVAVADVNGDGKADLISISSDQASTSTVSVLLGDGHGNFQPASSQQTVSGINPSVVGLADLDGDGLSDIVLYVQSPSAFNLVWLKNKGDGSFAKPVSLTQVAGFSVAMADFNHDGKPDFLYGLLNTSTGTSVFHLLLNQGGGKFTDQVAAGLSSISGVPTVIDFNLDGVPDLVIEQTVLGQPASTLYSFLGNGDGSFSQVASVSIPYAYPFVTGDFDHDGFPDLAGGGILYLFGDGHGNFTLQQIVGPEGNAIGVGDINGDGLPDIVVSDRSFFVAVALGQRDRNFPSPLTLHPQGWGYITLGDINGDGLLDIFVGGVDDPVDGLFLPGTVFVNQGDGAFGLDLYTDPTSFAVENLTGTGLVDLVGTSGNSLVIWPNNGAGGFSSSPITIPTLSIPGPIHVADIDGDGHPDIVTTNQVFFGQGSYQFTSVPLAIDPNFVVGDFNGDGKLDILSGSTLFLNTGNRTFQSVTTNVPSEGFSIAVGDFNGDGKDDLVLNDSGTVFSIWSSKGDGTFYQSAQLSLGGQAQAGAFQVGDFNGDGRLDLAVAVYPTYEVAMFFNQPGGQFTLSYFVSGPGAFAMRFGDLNRNGKLDLVLETYPPLNPPTTAEVVFHK
jgi:hypothetical protein